MGRIAALYVMGQDVIASLPWDEWWNFELSEDDANPHIALLPLHPMFELNPTRLLHGNDANPHIALLPLHPDLRAKFNETAAAWEYAQSMIGLPYGYHNLIFSWIDTISDNYPPLLNANLVASVMTVWNQMQPAYAANMWNEALNKRLGTKGQDVIALLPWDEWWNFELPEDDANPHIALLPLHPDLRAKFNETAAAWEYAQSMIGLPYGYHNLIFSWIDTISDNYPPLLNANLVASVMTVWNQMQPAYAANMWNEALYKWLGTQGLELPDILVEVERHGSSFAELLTISEQDDWIYADGKSTSCVAFVLEMYKEA
ncbi:hypothetical protein Tco_1252676 [Tanacetum coccineum]